MKEILCFLFGHKFIFLGSTVKVLDNFFAEYHEEYKCDRCGKNFENVEVSFI